MIILLVLVNSKKKRKTTMSIQDSQSIVGFIVLVIRSSFFPISYFFPSLSQVGSMSLFPHFLVFHFLKQLH